MRPVPMILVALTLAACGGHGAAPAPGVAPATGAPRFLAVIGDTSSRIEGIGLFQGQLYVNDWKDGAMYRVDPGSGAVTRLGRLGTKPGEGLGAIVFDGAGNMYVAGLTAGVVYRVMAPRLGAADFDGAKDVSIFATAKGANALAFDAAGHLWITGGGQKTLYHVGPEGGMATVFARDFSPPNADTTWASRGNTVNGIAFDSHGNIYTLNTGAGEVTRLEVKPGYTLGAVTPIVRDPSLLGADGALMLPGDTLLVTSNFLSSLSRVTMDGKVTILVAHHPAIRAPAEVRVIGRMAYLANANFQIGVNKGTGPGTSIAAVPLP